METVTKDSDLKNIAKSIKRTLSEQFPQCEFSVTIERYSMGQSMTIALMKAPFNAIVMERVRDFIDGKEVYRLINPTRGYAQLNQYTIKDADSMNGCNGVVLSQKARECMMRAYEITQNFNWDRSDSQTDYFDVNFYLHLAIGKWNKNFVNTRGAL